MKITRSSAALQQAGIQLGFSHSQTARMTGVSKRTIWLTVTSQCGSRKEWTGRTEEEKAWALESIAQRACNLCIIAAHRQDRKAVLANLKRLNSPELAAEDEAYLAIQDAIA